MKQTVKIALATSLMASMLALQGCPPASTPSSPTPSDTSSPSVVPSSAAPTDSAAPSSAAPSSAAPSSTAPSSATPTATAPSSTAPSSAAPSSAAPSATAVASYVIPLSMDSGKSNVYLSEKDGTVSILANFDNVDPTPTLVSLVDGFGNTVASSSTFNISGVTGNTAFKAVLNGIKLLDCSVVIKTTNNTKVYSGKVNANSKVDTTPAPMAPTGSPISNTTSSSSSGGGGGGGSSSGSSTTCVSGVCAVG